MTKNHVLIHTKNFGAADKKHGIRKQYKAQGTQQKKIV